jgi:hypothetical protein
MERPVLRGGKICDSHGVEYLWDEDFGWVRKDACAALDWFAVVLGAVVITVIVLMI